MKLAVFTCFILCCILNCQGAFYTEQYYEQKVDHFNYHWQTYRQETYKQRYLIYDKFWKRGEGPIFLYTGNEGDIVVFWNNTGFIFDIAPEFNALILFAEHRFYGKSLPFGDKSFSHPYVDLLTVEQALADFATLTEAVKSNLNATKCPVIAFGGSYGGVLSAYMRFRFPNIVAGSIAASAPIYGIVNESPRKQFFQDVTHDFDNAQKGCKDGILKAYAVVKSLFSSGKEGLKNVSDAFNTCDTLRSDDYNHFIGWSRNAFTVLAMMDYPYPTSFLTPLPGHPVNGACDRLSKAKTPLHGLAAITDMVYGDKKCHKISEEYVECADPTGCGLGPDSLAWDYQVCTDFIMPDGTYNSTDMFPSLTFTLDERDQYCQKRWDLKPRNSWPKINFWGRDIKSASNIVFSNGLLDPWARGGVLKNVTEALIAVTISEGAHHLDLRGANSADPPSVIQARNLEKFMIANWIKDY